MGLPASDCQAFEASLSKILHTIFLNSWYPEQPLRNSGNRCIRIQQPEIIDPVIVEAVEKAGLDLSRIIYYLPLRITLWIDPGSVCYRASYRDPIITVYNGHSVCSDVDSCDDLELTNTNSWTENTDFPYLVQKNHNLYKDNISYSVPGSPLYVTKKKNYVKDVTSFKPIHVGTT